MLVVSHIFHCGFCFRSRKVTHSWLTRDPGIVLMVFTIQMAVAISLTCVAHIKRSVEIMELLHQINVYLPRPAEHFKFHVIWSLSQD